MNDAAHTAAGLMVRLFKKYPKKIPIENLIAPAVARSKQLGVFLLQVMLDCAWCACAGHSQGEP